MHWRHYFIKIAGITLFEQGNGCVCFHTICVVLAIIVLTISIGIGAYFVYILIVIKKLVLKKVLIIKQHFLIKLINVRKSKK